MQFSSSKAFVKPPTKATHTLRAGPRVSSRTMVRMSANSAACRSHGTPCKRTFNTARPTFLWIFNSFRMLVASRRKPCTVYSGDACGKFTGLGSPGGGLKLPKCWLELFGPLINGRGSPGGGPTGKTGSRLLTCLPGKCANPGGGGMKEAQSFISDAATLVCVVLQGFDRCLSCCGRTAVRLRNFASCILVALTTTQSAHSSGMTSWSGASWGALRRHHTHDHKLPRRPKTGGTTVSVADARVSAGSSSVPLLISELLSPFPPSLDAEVERASSFSSNLSSSLPMFLIRSGAIMHLSVPCLPQ
mmetsp:Transcript_82349/g.163390  ORF Transcript_82349/g.163390 Transcript_82349/m.163390 type:complete len:303 (+) Transcript_82349:361-1269(+)